MSAKEAETRWIYDRSGDQLAFIIRANFKAAGVEFLTPDTFGQQIGYMTRPQGEIIQAHVHEQITRTIVGTQEVLILRSGIVRLDLYEHDRTYVGSPTMHPGDVVLLNKGGHSLEIIEEADIIEIKQGPYAEGKDKTRFETPQPSEIIELFNSVA
jgi:hypothetical protein